MKDELVSMTEAAQILGVSKMTLSIWSNTGLLKAIPFRRAKKFYRSEILHFRELRGNGVKPQHIGEDLRQIKYKMYKFERLMNAVMDYLQLPEKPIIFTDQSLNSVYEEATRLSWLFRSKEFDYDGWKGILRNLHEEHFRRLRLLRGDPCPYLPFIRLCEKIIHSALSKNGKENNGDTDYKSLATSFLLIRNALRDKAIIFLSEEPKDISPEKRLDLLMDGALQGNNGVQEGQGGLTIK